MTVPPGPEADEPGYYGRINPDLLTLLPRDAEIVVEIGCGRGALGAEYAALNPQASYIGIERNGAAALRARRVLAQVELADIEAFDLAALGVAPGAIDCLVYGDVLEHLIDPWGLLKRHAEWLSPNGVVLACIPNVQHWTVLLNLLAGEWPYQAEGLMDRSHLRWFTRDSIGELFRSAGLAIAETQRRVVADNRIELFLQAVEPTLSALHLDRQRFADDARTLQYVVKAVPDPTVTWPSASPAAATSGRLFLHHIITYRGAVGALATHRIRVPGEALAQRPLVSCRFETPANMHPAPSSAGERVMILQRVAVQSGDVDFVRSLIRDGYVVVMDFDDHPDYNPLVAENDYLTFRGVHAVQTSTDYLADLVRRWNREIAVFSNGLGALPPPRTAGDRDEVTICFAAINRDHDWAPILPALNRVISKSRHRVHVSVVFDRGFFDAVATPNKSFRALLDYDGYLTVLAAADIALMPLLDTEFNRCKSDLKFLEAAACGAVALAPRMVYGATIRNGRTGLVYDTVEEFAAGLARLVDDATLRSRLAQAAYGYVARDRMIQKQLPARERWYRSLVARRDEMTAALLTRAPELR